MTTRRGFLAAMLAASAAPAIVRAGSLMPIWVPPQGLVLLSSGLGDVRSFSMHGDWTIEMWTKLPAEFSNGDRIRLSRKALS